MDITPAEAEHASDEDLRRILTSFRTIAIVGASADRKRPSYDVMKVLIAAGFNVIPVTPFEKEVLGRPAFRSLSDVPEPVEIVDVFRRAEELPAVAEEAVAIGAKVLWLQLGLVSNVAATIARKGGLEVVMDACIGAVVHRLDIRHGTG